METNTNNNLAEVCGVVDDELQFNHEIFGEGFYTFTLKIPRLSGTSDRIKVMVSDRLLSDFTLDIGDEVEVVGQFRSYNSYENGDNRLILTVFAKDICYADKTEEKNPSAYTTVSAENGPNSNLVADNLSRMILGISSVFLQYALSFSIHIFKFPQPSMPITLSPCVRFG